MPLFLTIMEGDRPSEAKPLVATGDENLIGLVVDELCRRLSEQRVS